MRMRNLTSSMALAALVLGGGFTAAAQVQDPAEWLERCRAGDGWTGSDARERHCEIREFTLPADGSTLAVDGRQNGGITVSGWDRNEILVQALITSAAATAAQAEANAREIQVQSAGNRVRADGPSRSGPEWWSVSYRVYVPNSTDLDLRTVNGGLRVSNVSGNIGMETSNGALRLEDVAGDVRGHTANGAIHVRLAGQRWQGAGLDLRTSNGAINLHIPDGYSAQLETGTVNGRVNTEIPLTVRGDIRRELNAQLGQGGPPIRVRTTNGAVRIQQI